MDNSFSEHMMSGRYFFIFSVVKTESRFLLFFIRKRNESAFSFVFFSRKETKKCLLEIYLCFYKNFFQSRKVGNLRQSRGTEEIERFMLKFFDK